MTPSRLHFIIAHYFRARRQASLTAHYADLSRFLGIDPHTLRRWLSGRQPIPRTIDIIFEVIHNWPDITPDQIDEVIAERDRRDVGGQ